MIYHVSISYVMLLRVNLSVAVVAMTTNKTHHLANGTTVEVRIQKSQTKTEEKATKSNKPCSLFNGNTEVRIQKDSYCFLSNEYIG